MATYSSVLIWRISWTEWETTEAAEWRQHPFLWADAVSSGTQLLEVTRV